MRAPWRAATAEAARAANVSLEVSDLRWESVGSERPLAYDLVFHDALHWNESPDAMQAALTHDRRDAESCVALPSGGSDADPPPARRSRFGAPHPTPLRETESPRRG
jgi:hypothetical protein